MYEYLFVSNLCMHNEIHRRYLLDKLRIMENVREQGTLPNKYAMYKTTAAMFTEKVEEGENNFFIHASK